MTEHLLVGLASIIALGIGAQWLAWRLKLPSILILLVLGFIAGPITGFLAPAEIFGDLLLPVVSVSVAVILFEGGLSLRIGELREIGKVVRNLITIGVLVTWLLATAAAHFILHLNLPLAILLGAILVVTGPTVIGPLLRHVRPAGRVGNIVKWEGIMNDPIGVLISVLVFEAILIGEFQKAGVLIISGVLKAIFVSGAAGVLSALLLVYLIKRYWIPDFLQQTVTLMLVIVTFVVSDFFQEESGLFAVTVMGIVLANQKKASIKHIIEFKENLRILIISNLFILLAARLQLRDFSYIDWASFLFLAVLIFLVRPVAVILSALGSALNWRECLFVSWMAPRGIVAAAVSSIFALRLAESGHPQTEYLVPVVFLVIIGTVILYGLTAAPLARWLKLAQANPQGVLIVGAHDWARAMAKALREQGVKVLLVDSNRDNIYAARMEGLATYHGDILWEHILDEIDLDGIGRLLALTSNSEANSLAALRFSEVFGRAEVFQLSQESEDKGRKGAYSPQHLRGRFLFGLKMTYNYLDYRFAAGASIKTTKLTATFDYADFKAMYGDAATILFLVTESKTLKVVTSEVQPSLKPGHTVISLANSDYKA